jgi:hypothetical protein
VEEVRGGEGFKFGGDDVGPGVNAGFEGVEAIGVDLGLAGKFRRRLAVDVIEGMTGWRLKWRVNTELAVGEAQGSDRWRRL